MPRAAKVIVGFGLLLLLLLTFVDATSSNRAARRRRRRQLNGDPAEVEEKAGSPASAAPPNGDFSALGLQGCGRVFIDGGSNTGESVRYFAKGGFFGCALNSPTRQYASSWSSMTRRQRAEVMHPLREPSTFCVRSFEAAPELMPMLRKQEAELRAEKLDVRFLEAALSNVTSAAAPRTLVTYARNPWGVSAVGLRFEDVHVGGKPVPLSSRVVVGQSYDLRGLVAHAVALNASSTIAIKLDIEGSEYWALESLMAEPSLICAVSYLFIEFHSTASAEQRSILKGYGLKDEEFEHLKGRAHAAMEQPGCKLKIYWRSFWASCGDKQRFEWRVSEQATKASDGTEVPG